MKAVAIVCLCLVASTLAAPCQKNAAVKFLDNFNRHYPKLADLDVPHHQDLIIGCKLDGTKQFVLLYPSNSSLRVSFRSSNKSLTTYIEDQNIDAPDINVSWCIKSFLDLKYFMDNMNQRILKCNANDFSISDTRGDSRVGDTEKICQGLATDTATGDKFKVRLAFSVVGSTLTTVITSERASVQISADEGRVRTESA